jgi:hypothetical protein
MPDDFDNLDHTPLSDEDVPDFYARMNAMSEAAMIANGTPSEEYGAGTILLYNIFDPYPCFQAWQKIIMAETGDGRLPVHFADGDPTAGDDYDVMAHDAVLSFHKFQSEINNLVAEEKAQIAQTAPLDFSRAIPIYQPKTEVILTEDRTIMRVTETRSYNAEHQTRGAPQDMVSLYVWPGGQKYYHNNPGQMQTFVDLVTTPRQITFARRQHQEPMNPEPGV